MLKRNKIYLILGLALVVILAVAIISFKSPAAGETEILVPVKKGRLDINVTTTGELQALNSEDIKGPFGLQQIGVYQVKLAELVPEGTVVKAGDYIGTLDRSDISGRMKDLNAELSKIESQYLQTRLDTALEMRKLRDDLVNQKYTLEEKKIILDQSKYEAPAVIRQAEIDLEKTERAYEQAQQNYSLKLQQNRAKMQEVAATLNLQQAKLDQMQSLLNEFIIKAPKDGMVIYRKDWNGRKIETGSTISVWNPAVATLPDLSVMVSKTYVNEIDISKIKKDQKVSVSVDAFPDKKFQGTVISVANIGEQLPKTATKVFEVTIKINGKDTLLRPAMTSANVIMTNSLDDVLYIPFDAVQNTDSAQYVYTRKGGSLVRKEVVIGAMSSDMAEIKAGLKEGEKIYLSLPADTNNVKLIALAPDIKEKYKTKPAETQDEDKEEDEEKAIEFSLDKIKVMMKQK